MDRKEQEGENVKAVDAFGWGNHDYIRMCPFPKETHYTILLIKDIRTDKISRCSWSIVSKFYQSILNNSQIYLISNNDV